MNRRMTAGRQASLALAFTGVAAIALLLSSAQSSWASDSGDPSDFNRSPDDGPESHRFDICGMDRSELTRAFAGQLTVLPEAQAVQPDREIVFIDPGVPERAKLLRSISKKARVIELTSGRDGLSQIAAALSGERNVSAVHIISHGGEARIKLVGSADVSLETLPEHLEQLEAIHNAMARGGDILLYGCDIAKGDDGKLFVNVLSHLTGENVAASENLTGAASRGGDWVLEFQAGAVHTRTLAPEASENFSAVLASYVVTKTADPTQATVFAGDGTLRGEILDATNNGGGTITFSLPKHSTIVLTTTGDTSAGPSALGITTTITIDGSGAPGLVLSGNNAQRIFMVASTGTLTLTNLTLSSGFAGGQSGGNGSTGPANGGGGGGSAGLGGAIFVSRGALTMTGCTLSANAAAGGTGVGVGGGFGDAGGGGGGLLTAGGSSLSNYGAAGGDPNAGAAGVKVGGGSGGFGGGGGGGSSEAYAGGTGGFGGGGGGGGGSIGSAGGAGGVGGFGGGGGAGGDGITPGSDGIGGYGGGVASNGIGGSGAGMGGAIFMYGGILNATSCTITGNSAIGGNGIGSSAGKGLGGGIFSRNGSCTILNSTIDANTAADGGGGIFNYGDALPPNGTGNTANVTMNNTIVADSTAGVIDYISQASVGGAHTAVGGGNLIPSSTNLDSLFVITTTPTKLAALADNGGPTQTLAVFSGSPVINAGDTVNNTATAPTADQRGDLRPDAPDIGAFEFFGRAPVTSVGVPTNGVYHIGQVLSFTVNFNSIVDVTGTPFIGLTVGANTRSADFFSGSGSSSLVFSYTVVSGDSAPSGVVLDTAITLNGGTIQDTFGANAVLTLNNVPSTSGVTVNGIQPAVIANTANLAVNAPSVVITGSSFDPVAANNTVTFNDGAVGAVTTASTTSLTVTFSTQPTSAGSLTAVVITNGNSSGAPVQVATVTPIVTATTGFLASNASSIVIHGLGFDPTPGNNSVTFDDGAVGTVTAASSTALTVSFTTLPTALGILNASAVVNGSSSGAPVQVATVVYPPVVTPNTASIPANAVSLVIKGANFDAVAANDAVTFNDGAAGTVSSASATSLTVLFTTNPITAGSLTAIVTSNGNISSGAAVQVATVTPVVTPNTSTIAATATTIVIAGFGFDPTATNNTVVFNNGAVGTVTTASATSLTVTFQTMPTGGSLTAIVTTNGVSSGAAVQVAALSLATTTTLTSSPNPSRMNQTVTFTATVTASGSTPTGRVAFYHDGVSLAVVALDTSGKASFSTAFTTAMTANIVAMYLPTTSSAFLSSTSNAVQQVVNARPVGTLIVDAQQASAKKPTSSEVICRPDGSGGYMTYVACITGSVTIIPPTGDQTLANGNTVLLTVYTPVVGVGNDAVTLKPGNMDKAALNAAKVGAVQDIIAKVGKSSVTFTATLNNGDGSISKGKITTALGAVTKDSWKTTAANKFNESWTENILIGKVTVTQSFTSLTGALTFKASLIANTGKASIKLNKDTYTGTATYDPASGIIKFTTTKPAKDGSAATYTYDPTASGGPTQTCVVTSSAGVAGAPLTHTVPIGAPSPTTRDNRELAQDQPPAP